MTQFGLFDCDTHCYEPREALTKYLPKKFKRRGAVLPVRNADGDEVILVGSRIAEYISEQSLGFDLAYRPGSLAEMLRQMASGDPEETYQPEPMRAEFLERDARLKLMAKQGVEKAVLYPAGMAFSVEHYLDDTEALYANIRSFNRWYNEAWGFNYQDTIYAAALLSLRDLDLAVAETDRLIAEGVRIVLLPTGPAYGRSPGDPYFDPIYSRLNEAGVTIAYHLMPFWYFDAISGAWGHDPNPNVWKMSAWQWNNVYGERPIQDTLSAIIFDNLFGRHPNLTVLVSEHGAEWLPHFLSHMDKSRGMGRGGPWIGGKLTERPSQIFQRHVRIAPYPEDNVPLLVERLGSDECVVMGSDYPHAEGLAEPADFSNVLDPLPDDVKRRILRTNAEQIFSGPRA